MDSFILTGPNGTWVDVGSWIQADPGPDFDFDAVAQRDYTESPFVDGGAPAFVQNRVRRMKFPLLAASNGTWAGLSGLENVLRGLARPGATLDLGFDGVASTDRIRFDVLGGRVKVDYQQWHHRAGRHRLTLELDTQPIGYLPTWILLASTATMTLPGALAIPSTLLLGDAPGYGRVFVQPSIPAIGSGAPSTLPTYMTDALWWSLAAPASLPPLLHGGSWTSPLPTSAYSGDPVNQFPAATGLTFYVPSGPASGQSGTWMVAAVYDIPAALEPAFRGRHRIVAYPRPQLAADAANLIAVDAVPLANPSLPFASAAKIATAQDLSASHYAVQVADLGEISLPPVASGFTQGVRLRMWIQPASVGAIRQFIWGGLSLLPADGPAGAMPRGLAYPDRQRPTQSRLVLDAYEERAIVAAATGGLATTYPVANALAYHRGGLPYVGASTTQLLLAGAARRASIAATDYVNRPQQMQAAAALFYQPRFQFLKAGV